MFLVFQQIFSAALSLVGCWSRLLGVSSDLQSSLIWSGTLTLLCWTVLYESINAILVYFVLFGFGSMPSSTSLFLSAGHSLSQCPFESLRSTRHLHSGLGTLFMVLGSVSSLWLCSSVFIPLWSSIGTLASVWTVSIWWIGTCLQQNALFSQITYILGRSPLKNIDMLRYMLSTCEEEQQTQISFEVSARFSQFYDNLAEVWWHHRGIGYLSRQTG